MTDDLRIFLGLGSNLKDRFHNLKKGINLIDNHAHIWIVDQSYIYESTPMYHKDQNNYYNMVIEITMNLNPLQLLDEIKNIEIMVGRNPKRKKNMPRTLDVDILAMGDLLIRSNLLHVPHPRITERKFVLKPWNDIAPEFILPNINKNINELLKNTKDRSSIRMLLMLDKEDSI